MASNNSNGGNNGGRSNRGFAAMDPAEQRAIARKGGEAVSQDREHMAAIGRKGGEASGGGNRGRGGQGSREDGMSAGSRDQR
jgi:general stress protein YciG